MREPQTFESRLAVALGRYTADGPVEVDAVALARTIVADERAGRSPGRSIRSAFQQMPWAARSIIAALLIAVVVGAMVLVGSQLTSTTVLDRGVLTPTGTLIDGPMDSWSATRIDDGRVLVVGGYGPYHAAELWDPVSGEWTVAGSRTHGRIGHTAVLLADGRVLIVGGHSSDNGDENPPLELWDPTTQAFVDVGGLTSPAGEPPAAHRLADGRVLIGRGDTAEVWDPVTSSLAPAGPLSGSPIEPDGTRLPDGRMVTVDRGLVEVWDPATGSMASIEGLPGGKRVVGADPLPDGRVAIVVQQDVVCTDDPDSSISPCEPGDVVAEIWDPVTGKISHAGSTAGGRDVTATSLLDGRVLVVVGTEAFVLELADDEANGDEGIENAPATRDVS